MVKLKENFDEDADDKSAAISIILLSVSILSLVIAVLGIKLRWFRHRLTLEQPETQSDSPVLLRTTSVTEFRENCARGVYRQSSGDDSQILSNNATVSSNSKTNTKTNDRHSIFRLPFKSKLNLSRNSSRDDSQVSTIQQAVSTTRYHQHKPHDESTMQKNENLRRMIHERLHSQTATSMPDLLNKQELSPRQYRERSVDGHKEVAVNLVQQETEPLRKPQKAAELGTPQETVELSNNSVEYPPEPEPSDQKKIEEEIFQNRVKFEKVNEIEENFFEAQFENDIGESSIDSSTDDKNFYTPPTTPYYVEEVEEFSLPPPTPMKRKSRENSFNEKPAVMKIQAEVEAETKPEIVEFEPPAVKPRTKRYDHGLSDVGSDEVDAIPVIRTLQEEIKFSERNSDHSPHVNVEGPEVYDVKIDEKFDMYKSNEAVVEIESSEIQNAPKSILKSSETEISSTQKTITFHNMPQSISYQEASSSSSLASSSSSSSSESEEEEDVWSKVDLHRQHLNRNQKKSDVPPPLPKTPPPFEDEEKEISFA